LAATQADATLAMLSLGRRRDSKEAEFAAWLRDRTSRRASPKA
jgi:hypothetical protein